MAMTIEPTTWRGMQAWAIRGDRLGAVITVIGGHLAALNLEGETLNPYWQPGWMPADPASVDPDRDQVYGGGVGARLLAAIVGHNLCIDRFGPPWPGEHRPAHGEAGVVAWRLEPGRDTIELRATLPEARLEVRRRIRLEGTRCTLATGVRHDGPAAREIEWCEHVTMGGAFLDGVRFTAGVDRVTNWPGTDAEPGSRFAAVPPEGDIPVADALAYPAPDAPPCGDVLSARVADGFWSAENPRLRRRLTYRWDARQFPWLALWTQHRSRGGAPWNGRERTRGMELSTKPFPEGRPPAARARTYQDRPTVCSVPPGAWLDHQMAITWEAML